MWNSILQTLQSDLGEFVDTVKQDTSKVVTGPKDDGGLNATENRTQTIAQRAGKKSKQPSAAPAPLASKPVFSMNTDSDSDSDLGWGEEFPEDEVTVTEASKVPPKKKGEHLEMQRKHDKSIAELRKRQSSETAELDTRHRHAQKHLQSEADAWKAKAELRYNQLTCLQKKVAKLESVNSECRSPSENPRGNVYARTNAELTSKMSCMMRAHETSQETLQGEVSMWKQRAQVCKEKALTFQATLKECRQSSVQARKEVHELKTQVSLCQAKLVAEREKATAQAKDSHEHMINGAEDKQRLKSEENVALALHTESVGIHQCRMNAMELEMQRRQDEFQSMLSAKEALILSQTSAWDRHTAAALEETRAAAICYNEEREAHSEAAGMWECRLRSVEQEQEKSARLLAAANSRALALATRDTAALWETKLLEQSRRLKDAQVSAERARQEQAAQVESLARSHTDALASTRAELAELHEQELQHARQEYQAMAAKAMAERQVAKDDGALVAVDLGHDDTAGPSSTSSSHSDNSWVANITTNETEETEDWGEWE